jgi:hypothetical protein
MFACTKFSCHVEGIPRKIMFFKSVSDNPLAAGGFGNSGRKEANCLILFTKSRTGIVKGFFTVSM